MVRCAAVPPRRRAFLAPSLSAFRIRLCPWRAPKLTARDAIENVAFSEAAAELWLHVTLPSSLGSAPIGSLRLEKGPPLPKHVQHSLQSSSGAVGQGRREVVFLGSDCELFLVAAMLQGLPALPLQGAGHFMDNAESLHLH